MKASRSSASI